MPLRFAITPRPGPVPFDVVVIGENSVDIVATAADADAARSKRRLRHLDWRVGGQAATAAVAAARLGGRARYVGAVGDDDAGMRVRTALQAQGVDVHLIERRGVRTRTAVIVVEPDGDRVVYEHCDPRLPLGAGDVDRSTAAAGSVLLVDATSSELAIDTARFARAAGVVTLVDVDRTGAEADCLLDHIDIIVVPAPFVREWGATDSLEEGMRRMTARFETAKGVVTTLGAEGSMALVDGVMLPVPGYAVDVVDTTGAGDAFRGGLAAAWVRLAPTEPDVATLLRYANATAALNCRGLGAQESLPTWDEVERLVTSGGHARSK